MQLAFYPPLCAIVARSQKTTPRERVAPGACGVAGCDQGVPSPMMMVGPVPPLTSGQIGRLEVSG